MYIAILGRQPALGMAELERCYGSAAVKWFSNESAVIDTADFDFARLGGSLKAGKVIMQLNGNWHDTSQAIVEHYVKEWSAAPHKITLGISAYGYKNTARDIQKTGVILKQKLKKVGTSLRAIPNDYPALNTATSHHNKLGLAPNKVEVIAVRAGNGAIMVAESVGAQNITGFAARDQARPHTDAFVGMLPPKLARIMVNLAVGAAPGSDMQVLDPFCGTGVVLQEALLDGYRVIGTDLSEKMVDYTTKNLAWLTTKFNLPHTQYRVAQGDATTYRWDLASSAPLYVVSESYLGQPFSAPPKPEKLVQVRGNCNHIISNFLTNIHPQIKKGTVLCLAVPAWRSASGQFTHLPLVTSLPQLGYSAIALKNVQASDLLYYRESQVVARQLLLITRA